MTHSTQRDVAFVEALGILHAHEGGGPRPRADFTEVERWAYLTGFWHGRALELADKLEEIK